MKKQPLITPWVVPVEGCIGAVVDVLNTCTTLGTPMDIFDISPEAEIGRMDVGSFPMAK